LAPKYVQALKKIIQKALHIMTHYTQQIKWIKGQRLSWLGHLERMEEDRMPKKIFTQELKGTRRRGRPRKNGTRK